MTAELFLGPCKDCDREMVLQKVWPLRPDLHEGRARAGGFGMCNGCYARARRAGTLPDPAPRTSVWLPEVAIAPSYPVVCAACGLLGTPTHRDEAVRIRDTHMDGHRSALGLPVPARRALSDGEVARLRELVGAVEGGGPHPMKIPPEVRFARSVKPGPTSEVRPDLGPCLIFDGAPGNRGYVRFRYHSERKAGYAHRFAWERANGPIPDGMTVKHLCLVPACVEVTHLVLASATSSDYRVVHNRIRRLRGSASSYSCPCGEQAADWAYMHSDPEQIRGEASRGCLVWFSTKPEHYAPRCRPCHSRLDAAYRRGGPLEDEGGAT